MSVEFLDIQRQVLAHPQGAPIVFAEADPLYLSSWSDSRAGEASDWNAILEESGSSQFALHVVLLGIRERERPLQR
jgi:hypothetical protein